MTYVHGIISTSQGVRNQLRLSLRYADHYGMPMPVLWKSHRSSSTPTLLGHSKPLLNTRMIGKQRGGKPVETHIARGFLVNLLSNDHRLKLKELERLEPEGKYYPPFQAGKILKVALQKEVTNEEISAMEATWLDFCQAKDLDQRSTICSTEIREAWGDWVASNYTPPLPATSNSPWGN